MVRFGNIRATYETEGRRVARRVVTVLGVSRVNPNHVTVTGSVLNGVAAVLVFHERFLEAAIVFILGSVLDALDGAVAKVSGRVSAFGAFLDSTLDRISEGLVLGGLGLLFADQDNLPAVAACFVALAGSYLVSYTRAKAEALGVQCKGGFASRTERVVLLAAGILLAEWWPIAIEATAYVLAVTTALTVVQRVIHVNRALPAGRKPRRRRSNTRRKSSESTPEVPRGAPRE